MSKDIERFMNLKFSTDNNIQQKIKDRFDKIIKRYNINRKLNFCKQTENDKDVIYYWNSTDGFICISYSFFHDVFMIYKKGFRSPIDIKE